MSMYHGNPVLTIVIFGLPLSFLSFIIYSSCCSDILDAVDEEDEEAEGRFLLNLLTKEMSIALT